MRFGFEHQFATGSLRPYGAIDFAGRHERVQLTGEGWGGDFIAQLEPEQFGYDFSTMYCAITISLGLEWRFSKRFSCSAESGCWFDLIADGDAANRYHRSTVYFDVLRSFSFNYHWY